MLEGSLNQPEPESDEESRTLTIHETQGHPFENVAIVRTTHKQSQSSAKRPTRGGRHLQTNNVNYTDNDGEAASE